MGQGRADACRVVVNLHERRWWHATVGTYVDGAEGSVELKLGTTGVAGLAERAELDVRVGSQTSTEAALSLGRSRLGGRPLDGNAVVQQASRNCEAASSYVERLRGATLGVGRCPPPAAPRPGRRLARAARQPPVRVCGNMPGGVDGHARACAAWAKPLAHACGSAHAPGLLACLRRAGSRRGLLRERPRARCDGRASGRRLRRRADRTAGAQPGRPARGRIRAGLAHAGGPEPARVAAGAPAAGRPPEVGGQLRAAARHARAGRQRHLRRRHPAQVRLCGLHDWFRLSTACRCSERHLERYNTGAYGGRAS